MTAVRNPPLGRIVQWLCVLIVLSVVTLLWQSILEVSWLQFSQDPDTTPSTNSEAKNFSRRVVPPGGSSSNEKTVSLEITNPELHGVQPRAFPLWNPGTPLPCLRLEGGVERWKKRQVQAKPTTTGLLFVKPAKAGSTTAASVTLRIAARLANKRYPNNRVVWPLCKNRVQHAYTFRMGYDHRERTKSVLWSILREPTSRAVSQFFHFHASRMGMNATDEIFQGYLEADADVRDRPIRNFQLNYLSFHGIQNYADPITGFGNSTDPIVEINRILKDYDFIGVSERLDESVVALQLILGLETADVLHISAKGSGSYDDGAFQNKCFYIQKSFVSPGMATYFQSDYWKRVTYYDRLLHQAVNRSLDMTIKALGPELFRDNLAKYRTLQSKVASECLPTVLMPCDEHGVRRNETSCIFDDMGCGFECLDRVAAAVASR